MSWKYAGLVPEFNPDTNASTWYRARETSGDANKTPMLLSESKEIQVVAMETNWLLFFPFGFIEYAS